MKNVIINIILSIVWMNCYSQKDIYLSLEGGFGKTFLTTETDNQLGKFSSDPTSASILFGLSTRFDFSEKFSGNFGVDFTGYNYSSEYSTYTGQSSPSSDNFYLSLTVPVFLQSNFKISRSGNYFLTVFSGLNFGINLEDTNSPGGKGFGFLNEAGDSIIEEVNLIDTYKSRFTLNAMLGIGFEKITTRSNVWGFRLFLRAGLIRTFEGKYEHYVYNPPKPYDLASGQTLNQEGGQLVDEASFSSSNTSIFLTFYYAFNLRKKKKKEKVE